MVITYKKSDLFDLDALEQAITGKTPETEQTNEESTTESQSDIESVADTDSESEENSQSPESSATDATDPVTEADTPEMEEETEDNSVSAEMPVMEENAVYAEIYQDINDFMLTDNFKQKDPGNRALELFNHLHNLAHANIEQDSIVNDTEKQEIRFHCYEKYTITVNVADSVITVSEEES
ncbi:MAG: hypothetical protein K2H89_07120 [Oscillospiraceae bacterium]|nr:hypothetical protein [Oscillospiraceae bacterium]